MQTVADLLDRAKASNGAGSDYKLAQIMGVHQSRVSAWRVEREFPPADFLLLLADLAGDPVGYWYCIVQSRKANTDKMARRWRAAADSHTPEKTAA